MIGKYLYSKLSGDAAVAALVGTRVYPIFLPASASYPAIVYTVQSEALDNAMKNASPTLERYTATIHIWVDAKFGATAYDTLDEIAGVVRNSLERVETTAGGVSVLNCIYTGMRDGRDEDRTLFLREITFRFTVENT